MYETEARSLNITLKLRQTNLSLETIAEVTGLAIDQLQQLQLQVNQR